MNIYSHGNDNYNKVAEVEVYHKVKLKIGDGYYDKEWITLEVTKPQYKAILSLLESGAFEKETLLSMLSTFRTDLPAKKDKKE